MLNGKLNKTGIHFNPNRNELARSTAKISLNRIEIIPISMVLNCSIADCVTCFAVNSAYDKVSATVAFSLLLLDLESDLARLRRVTLPQI